MKTAQISYSEVIIDALLFDLDGTLTDPYLGISRCAIHAFERLGVPVPDEERLRAFIGPPLHVSFCATFNGDVEKAERAITLFRERFSEIGLFENTLYDGIPEMLQELARSSELFVCTSKPTLYAERILEHFGIRKIFRAVYGSELSGERSNKSELLRWLLEKEALGGRNVAMIGDREHDVLAATANGVDGYGVAWGYGSEAELRAAGAQCIFAEPAEITKKFLQYGAA